MNLAEKKGEKDGGQMYVPPTVRDGILHSGYLVSRVEETSVEQEPCDSSDIAVGTNKTVKITEEEKLAAEEECANLMAIDTNDCAEEE